MTMHKLSEHLKVTTGTASFVCIPPIDGQNTTQPTATTTGWVSMANYGSAIIYCMVGVIGAGGSGTFTVQQAQDSAGTGIKTVGTKTQAYTDASDGTVWQIDLSDEELDVTNGFDHIRVQVVCSNHSALVGALIVRGDPRYARATMPA